MEGRARKSTETIQGLRCIVQRQSSTWYSATTTQCNCTIYSCKTFKHKHEPTATPDIKKHHKHCMMIVFQEQLTPHLKHGKKDEENYITCYNIM